LKSLSYGINILEQKEKIAMAQMLPKLAIVGAYSFSNPNVIDGFEKRFGGGFSIGATLSIPLWHWGGNYNKYRSAKAQTNMQRLLLEDAQEKVSLQVNQARFKFEEAFKTYDMTGVNMDKADENLRQAQLGFYEGVLTSEDVMKAQTAWLQASSERIDAAIGIQMCKVYLTKVLGRMDY
jgi:outer membrane protein TolC